MLLLNLKNISKANRYLKSFKNLSLKLGTVREYMFTENLVILAKSWNGAPE